MRVTMQHLINFDHLGVLWVHFSFKHFAKWPFLGYFAQSVYLSFVPLILSWSLVINNLIFVKTQRALQNDNVLLSFSTFLECSKSGTQLNPHLLCQKGPLILK